MSLHNNSARNNLRSLQWKGLRNFFTQMGALTSFLFEFLYHLFHRPIEWREFLKQSSNIGLSTLPIVSLTGFIMGLVLTLQTRPVLVDFGAESWTPSMIAISIVREIGPVITALICAGKIGSGIGAELGAMRVTEQIDAMEVSGTHPMKFLVVTRVLATTFVLPILVFYADAIGIFGSYVAINLHSEISPSLFIAQVFEELYFFDLLPATIKTIAFGFAIGLIGCFKGYTTENGTEGVGRSANAAVVMASLAIFILDLMGVKLHDLFHIWHY